MLITDINNEEVIHEYKLGIFEQISCMIIDEDYEILFVGTFFNDEEKEQYGGFLHVLTIANKGKNLIAQ